MKSKLKEILNTEKFFFQKYIKKSSNKRIARKKNETFKTSIRFKAYSRFKNITLPKPRHNNISLIEALQQRKTQRNFSQKKLSKKTISTLLYFSAGILDVDNPLISRRFYPSAGALYPLEVYLISVNTDLNDKPFLYHYYSRIHSLEELWPVTKKEIKKSFGQSFVNQASAIIVITAMFRRSYIKYGERSYRYVMLEAGHLGQNLYLLASQEKIKICAVGGYFEEEINKILEIDGVEESVLYTLALG